MKSLKKYRVLKKHPKPISNSGRMVLLEEGRKVYLKPERHVKMLLKEGVLQEVKEVKRAKKKAKKKVEPKKKSKKKSKKKEEQAISEEPKEYSEDKLIQE